MRVAVAIGLTVGERTMLCKWSKGGVTPARLSLNFLIRGAFVDEHHAIAKTFVWTANADAILDIPGPTAAPAPSGIKPHRREALNSTVRRERRAVR